MLRFLWGSFTPFTRIPTSHFSVSRLDRSSSFNDPQTGHLDLGVSFHIRALSTIISRSSIVSATPF